MQNVINSNEKFGAVTTINYITSRQAWKCLCVCGKLTYKNATALTSTQYPSCGCKRNNSNILPDNLALKRQVITQYKVNATKRNIAFTLTEQEVFTIIFSNCHYCDSPPSNISKTRNRKDRKPKSDNQKFKVFYSGIDRVDNNKGYTVDNCVPCCDICNTSKNKLEFSVWKDWIKKVYSKTFNDYAKAVEPSGSKRETPEMGEDIV